MRKTKSKNYPNVRVSPETFEILKYLKKERGSSYDTVIRDMLSEFAPLLVSMVADRNHPNILIHGDREKITRYNIFLGAKQAYAGYWLRVKRQQEELEEIVKVGTTVKSKHKDLIE